MIHSPEILCPRFSFRFIDGNFDGVARDSLESLIDSRFEVGRRREGKGRGEKTGRDVTSIV